MKRILLALLVLLPLTAARADALTVRDVIELSKAGVGDEVLLALIDVDRSVFTLDAATIRQLKDAGVSSPVMIAMIRSGRTPQNPKPANQMVNPEPPNQTVNPEPANGEPVSPQVIVIDHHDQPATQQVAMPVVVPVAIPVYAPSVSRRPEFLTHTVVTDDGSAVRVRDAIPPNCTKAEPVYWGNGGKRRPGTWEPPPQIVCR